MEFSPKPNRRTMRRSSVDVVRLSNYSPLLPQKSRQQQRRYSVTPFDTAGTKALIRDRSSSFSHSKSLLDSSPQHSREDVSGCEEHHASQGHKCIRCLRRASHAKLPVMSNLIFDYNHGEIRQKDRPKTAFWTSVPQAHTSPMQSPKVQKKKPKEKDEQPKKTELDDEPLTADDFINYCIIDSQTPRIKPAQRPKTSSLFSQLLDEFIPGSNETETPETVEITIKPRGRSKSFTAVRSLRPVPNQDPIATVIS